MRDRMSTEETESEQDTQREKLTLSKPLITRLLDIRIRKQHTFFCSLRRQSYFHSNRSGGVRCSNGGSYFAL